MNIDGAAFNVDKYVSNMLQYKSLEELVQRGNAMVSEIKSLDSDMQMLVYENYNKFISATDTIRKMKDRVEVGALLWPAPSSPRLRRPGLRAPIPSLGVPASSAAVATLPPSSDDPSTPDDPPARAQEMEDQMAQLETNMGTISTKSEAVNNSLSARRGELERLNGAKKNLTKLQFIMDLPARLEECIASGELEVAVQCFRKATRILGAMGHVTSFRGIHDEAELIMRRLAQTLSARLQEPALDAAALGVTTRLLLQLEGNEEALLKSYLARRRKSLLELLAAGFPKEPPSAPKAEPAEGGGEDEGEGEGGAGAAGAEGPDEEDELPSAATDVAQLGAIFTPQLAALQRSWDELFMGAELDANVVNLGSSARVDAERKMEMIGELIGELAGGCVGGARWPRRVGG